MESLNTITLILKHVDVSIRLKSQLEKKPYTKHTIEGSTEVYKWRLHKLTQIDGWRENETRMATRWSIFHSPSWTLVWRCMSLLDVLKWELKFKTFFCRWQFLYTTYLKYIPYRSHRWSNRYRRKMKFNKSFNYI